MFDLPWFPVVLAGLAGATLSLGLERGLRPVPRWFTARPLATTGLHFAVWLLVYAGALALLQRPLFAATAVTAFFLFLVLVNNAKYHSLREPFIAQDFEYFTDALRHPRLYLPFLGLGPGLLALTAFAATLTAGLTLEEPLGGMALLAAVLVALPAAGLLGGVRGRLPVACFVPEEDLAACGLLASFWLYAVAERQPLPIHEGPFARLPGSDGAPLPDLVVVQSESFFDPRRCYSGIHPRVLAQYDQLRRDSAAHGVLRVAAWGANTVRTEFAFLSGLAPASLGVHRFNPYRRLAGAGGMALPGMLQKMGYRTLCIHPYPATFYQRHRVFPRLGFDEFLDLAGFADARHAGPYVADEAVADKVCDRLQAHRQTSAQPLFIFVITMENHGPLHLEKVGAGDVARFYTTPPATRCDDLTVYLRHLAGADAMIQRLRGCLQTGSRPGWLCFYGDHVPIMPEVYRTMGVPDGDTDYVVWGHGGAASGGGDMAVEELGMLLLERAGVIKKV